MIHRPEDDLNFFKQNIKRVTVKEYVLKHFLVSSLISPKLFWIRVISYDYEIILSSSTYTSKSIISHAQSPDLHVYELRHEKTGFLHMRKQRRRLASL